MSVSTAIFAAVSRKTNPFSTRWVRTGALPYLFPCGTTAAGLVSQLQGHDWSGSIIGPHGSGKSALLATMAPEIERCGRTVRSLTLHDGQRHLPANFAWPQREEQPGVIVIDGYEQLGWRAGRQLNLSCRRNGWGLLISAHRDSAASGFPVLFSTSADLAMVRRLIDCHLPPHDSLIQPDDIAAAFRAHHGNVREIFFALYDLFEQRSRALPVSVLNPEPSTRHSVPVVTITTPLHPERPTDFCWLCGVKATTAAVS